MDREAGANQSGWFCWSFWADIHPSLLLFSSVFFCLVSARRRLKSTNKR